MRQNPEVTEGGSSDVLAEASGPYQAELRDLWGGQYEPLMDLARLTTADWKGKNALLRQMVGMSSDVLIFCGERCLPPGSDQLLSVREASRAVLETKGRLPHVLFSGGVEDAVRIVTPVPLSALQINEISARRMVQRYVEEHGPHFTDDVAARISLDHSSENTGDQAYIVKGFLEGQVRAKKEMALIICLPVEHITRWTLTFAWAWRELKPEYRARLHVVTFANGRWNDETRCGMTRAEEAFTARKQGTDQEALKKFGYQLGVRLKDETEGEVRGYRCAAVLPSEIDGVFGTLA